MSTGTTGQPGTSSQPAPPAGEAAPAPRPLTPCPPAVVHADDPTAEDLTTWADRLEEVRRSLASPVVGRIVVVAQTASTQEAAARMAGDLTPGEPGLLVVAGSQYAGRGTHGRGWSSGPMGLALTMALPGADDPPEWLSLSVGLGVYRACAGLLEPGVARSLRVKRPNDVVLLRPDGSRAKVAGILVERRTLASGPVTLIGIGVNVRHTRGDWPPDLDGRAVSLAQLGSGASRIAVAQRLLAECSRVRAMDQAALELELGERLIN
ncbi:MAG: biotin--[acetyl-CoA-carboxylase] ligase [Phycisphaerales bacterium JB040]